MSLKRSLRIVNDDETRPDPATMVQVAFASADRCHVDQHFGAAEGFVVYRVGPSGYELLQVDQFESLAMDGNEDKLTAKIAALEGCIAVYCQAVGASAIGQLKAKGIQPIKVDPGTPVSGLLRDLQRDLRAGQTPWLVRAIEQQTPRTESRFDAMEAEGWSE